MKSPLLTALLLAAGAAFIGACGENSSEPVEAQAPEGAPGLTAENARMILPAVAGNPGVVYFDLANSSDRNYAVRRADIEGAGRTEMHGTMEMAGGEMAMSETGQQTVMAGETFAFEPGGYHLMAFDISPELSAGGTTEVTLTVAGGDKFSFEVPIQNAGDER